MNEYQENIGKKKNLRDAAYEILGDPDKSKGFFYKFAYVWMTRKCNSACRHCYQDGGPNGIAWSLEKAQKVTDMLLAKEYIVNPIINEWLKEFWPYMSILKKCGVKEISSNGTSFLEYGDAFVEVLKENEITDIRHTLFPEKFHKYYTGREYNNAVKAIEIAKRNGFRNVINYVVTKETLPFIETMCDEMKKLDISEVQFLNFIYSNRAKNLNEQTLTHTDIKKFWTIWENATNNKKYCDITFDFQANFGPNPYGNNIYKKASAEKKFCLAGCWEHGHYIYITPENDVFPCATLLDPIFRIGKIEESGENYELVLENNDWEKSVPGFNRAQCACLQYTQGILKNKLSTSVAV